MNLISQKAAEWDEPHSQVSIQPISKEQLRTLANPTTQTTMARNRCRAPWWYEYHQDGNQVEGRTNGLNYAVKVTDDKFICHGNEEDVFSPLLAVIHYLCIMYVEGMDGYKTGIPWSGMGHLP